MKRRGEIRRQGTKGRKREKERGEEGEVKSPFGIM